MSHTVPGRVMLGIGLLGLALGLGACGGDSGEPDPGSSDLEEQVIALFPAGEARNEAESLAEQLVAAAEAGNTATSQARAFDLAELTMREYYAARLGTAPAPLDKLITDAFALADLGDPGLTNASFAEDGLVAVVRAEGGTFVTASRKAGITIPSGGSPQTTLLAITRLADSSAYVPTDGPLPTSLDQYPYFFEFDFTPTVTLTADGIMGICQFSDEASAYYPADAVFARLQLAHPDPDDASAIELLEVVPAPFLDCLTATSNSRVPAAMARAGGIGGRVRKFSPFAAVDPQGATSGGLEHQLGQDLEGPRAGEQFGSDVALSANGNRMIVGSPLNGEGGANIGRARVFDFNGSSWVQVGADLVGAAADDRYGGAVAISNDGHRIAVGSYLNDGGGNASGMVRVFELVGGAWTQLGADINGEAGRGQGWSLDMNANGTRLVVGAPTPNSENGQVKVYEYGGGAWTQLGPTLAGNHEYGHAVAISGNGNRIAISHPSASGAQLPGGVTLADWNGTAWVQAGSVLEGEAGGDGFGGSLSLSADGNRLAVGASSNDGGGATAGHVRVFQFSSGDWTQVGADIDGQAGDSFGASVSLSADGNRLVGGGLPCGTGCVRLYAFSGGSWVQQEVDLGSASRLGAVAISPDGSTFAFGSVYYRGAAGAASGLVRVFRPDAVASDARRGR